MCPGDKQTPGRQFQWAERSVVAGSVYYAKSLFLTSFHIIITSAAFSCLTFSIDQGTQLIPNTLFMWAWPLPAKEFSFPWGFSHTFFFFAFSASVLFYLKFQWPNLALSVFLGRIHSSFTYGIRKSFTSHYVWKILWYHSFFYTGAW